MHCNNLGLVLGLRLGLALWLGLALEQAGWRTSNYFAISAE